MLDGVIRGLRRTRFVSLISVATLLSVLSLSASSLFHSDADDAICDPALVVHDHAAHRIGPDSGSSQTNPEHCFICHWHSIRTVQTVAQFFAPAAVSRVLAGTAVEGLFEASLARRPARAPPLA